MMRLTNAASIEGVKRTGLPAASTTGRVEAGGKGEPARLGKQVYGARLYRRQPVQGKPLQHGEHHGHRGASRRRRRNAAHLGKRVARTKTASFTPWEEEKVDRYQV